MARTERVLGVDDPTTQALRGLWARAAEADGVGAVSEAFRRAVGPARDGVVHLLRDAGDGTVVGVHGQAEVAVVDQREAAATEQHGGGAVGQRHPARLVERGLTVGSSAGRDDPVDDLPSSDLVVGRDPLDVQRWPSVVSTGSADGRSAVALSVVASFDGSTKR